MQAVFLSGTGLSVSGMPDMGKALCLKIVASDLQCDVLPVDILA